MEPKKINVVPKHYTTVTPWIISSSSAGLIEFLTGAFEAEEIPKSRITNEAGAIIHVVVKIGDALVMLFDSKEGWPPTPGFLNLYVADVEAVYQKSIRLGARSVTDVTALWFGEKVCKIIDPFGNLWWINQRIEEIDFTNPAEVGRLASTPEAVKGIAYIQQSLDESLKTVRQFFENR